MSCDEHLKGLFREPVLLADIAGSEYPSLLHNLLYLLLEEWLVRWLASYRAGDLDGLLHREVFRVGVYHPERLTDFVSDCFLHGLISQLTNLIDGGWPVKNQPRKGLCSDRQGSITQDYTLQVLIE